MLLAETYKLPKHSGALVLSQLDGALGHLPEVRLLCARRASILMQVNLPTEKYFAAQRRALILAQRAPEVAARRGDG